MTETLAVGRVDRQKRAQADRAAHKRNDAISAAPSASAAIPGIFPAHMEDRA
jgi:hypothetical protein